jgi:hypothetical protein
MKNILNSSTFVFSLSGINVDNPEIVWKTSSFQQKAISIVWPTMFGSILLHCA